MMQCQLTVYVVLAQCQIQDIGFKILFRLCPFSYFEYTACTLLLRRRWYWNAPSVGYAQEKNEVASLRVCCPSALNNAYHRLYHCMCTARNAKRILVCRHISYGQLSTCIIEQMQTVGLSQTLVCPVHTCSSTSGKPFRVVCIISVARRFLQWCVASPQRNPPSLSWLGTGADSARRLYMENLWRSQQIELTAKRDLDECFFAYSIK